MCASYTNASHWKGHVNIKKWKPNPNDLFFPSILKMLVFGCSCRVKSSMHSVVVVNFLSIVCFCLSILKTEPQTPKVDVSLKWIDRNDLNVKHMVFSIAGNKFITYAEYIFLFQNKNDWFIQNVAAVAISNRHIRHMKKKNMYRKMYVNYW